MIISRSAAAGCAAVRAALDEPLQACAERGIRPQPVRRVSDRHPQAPTVLLASCRPERLRGRAGLPAPVQAAELLVRDQLWCVHVATRLSTEPRLTSCAGSGTYGTPRGFDLVALRRLP